MASDLISRERLLAALGVAFKASDPEGEEQIGYLNARLIAREIPSVDAVEVVRCKDCENFWEYTEEHKATVENADGDCAIRKWRSDDEQFCAVTKDDYCSLARRKKNAVD